MKINCISCGHQIDVDDDSYARYHGPLRCWVCHAVLSVHIVDGCVESITVPLRGSAPVGAGAEVMAMGEISHE